MESKNAKDEAPKQTPESIASELETIRASLRKRKSDTTTLKILFYTGFAALLFGFFYTNQILQRAQHRNLESHVTLLQSQMSHTLLMLEKKLHEEIIDLDVKFSLHSGSNVSERIKNLNKALEQLEPQSTSMGILIEKVQRSFNELRQMVEAENSQEISPRPELIPLEQQSTDPYQ
jgi:hypothetical protein